MNDPSFSFVVDASGILFRSFFGMPPLKNKKGAPTGALFSFVRFLIRLKNDFPGSPVVIVLDGPNNKRRRREIYPTYKEDRIELDPDLYTQILEVPFLCDCFGISCLYIEGEEADDVIGSVVKSVNKKIGVVSFDKDLCQLVSSNVQIVRPTKDEWVFLNENGVRSEYGVLPHQIPAWLAIVGDSSDGLPGIPGLGPKTASNLLAKYGTLLNAIESYPSSNRIGNLLSKYKEQALFVEKFTHLIDTIILPSFVWEPPKLQPGLEEWLQEKGFISFLKALFNNFSS
ncbi:5'-3' exonuclease [Candidatus Similichlamydia epinepheli]|uniref:5'-3' exonuclease n=1 Tax=Candidatus Similichlamydia epinepheli TaxID=1903953 RepID=UPI000D368E59|nr:5'-3' exonuclease H3TH domain-containing protein [Candidatus Similichlamydia epinepheli]